MNHDSIDSRRSFIHSFIVEREKFKMNKLMRINERGRNVRLVKHAKK